MSDNTPAIYTGADESAPAPAPFGEPLGAPQSEAQYAELVGAAHFLDKADDRYPETQMVAEEIYNLIGGNPFQGDGSSGPARDANGRFVSSLPPGAVSHSAMHQERARRKEAETKLRETELRVAKAEERLGVLSELLQAAQNGPQQPQQQPQGYDPSDPDLSVDIDPEVDIFAAVKQLKKHNAQLKAEQSEKQFLDAYKADAIRFTQANPSHFDAHAYLVASRDRELELMGLADPAQRRRQIALEERELVRQNLAARRSPSQALFDLARLRGFTGGGRQPQPRQNVEYDPKIVEQLQRTQQGQSASTSLSGAGGSGGAGLSVQQIADMPEDQFDALIKKMGGMNSPQFKRAFGG